MPSPASGCFSKGNILHQPTPNPEPQILVVEDDGETRRLLVRLLREHGFRATGVEDGAAMWEALEAGRPDLVLLDLMLPRRPGLTLLRELRGQERWAELPVIIVTARGQVVDRTRGLELGADDYVAKPFDRRELLARIAAVLRRSAARPGRLAAPRLGVIHFSGWVLDGGRRTLSSPGGAQVDLSGAEYDLLTVFLDNPKRVLSRERLLELARNRVSVSTEDRSVDVQVSRLRGKLDLGGEQHGLIKTVRGIGYVFTGEVDA